jgi:hypothetical protein
MKFGILHAGKSYNIGQDLLRPYFRPGARPNFFYHQAAQLNLPPYLSLWEIADDKLYLRDLSGDVCVRGNERRAKANPNCRHRHHGDCETHPVTMEDYFDARQGRVHADWYNGTVEIFQSEIIQTPTSIRDTGGSRYMDFDVEAGQVTGVQIIGARQHHGDWLDAKRWRSRIGRRLRLQKVNTY